MRGVGICVFVLAGLVVFQYPVSAGGQPPNRWFVQPDPDNFTGSPAQHDVEPEELILGLHFGLEDRDTWGVDLETGAQLEDYVWDWFEYSVSNGGTVYLEGGEGWGCSFSFRAPDYTGETWSSYVTIQAVNTWADENRDDPDEFFGVWFLSW